MIFEDFLKDERARKSSPDVSLAKSLYKTAIDDLEYLKTQKINKFSARKLLTNYYDCLRAILESISALDGYKIYQHEAFVYYLKYRKEEANSIKFDRFRKIRNKINYYGENISIELAEDVISEIKRMIDYLIGKYLKEIDSL